jgi:hypothetical protein
VNNQVRLAMGKFEAEVMSGHLTVVGAVYDFKNEMHQGLGKLNIVNVNGETNPAKIAKLDLMQGLDAPAAKPACVMLRCGGRRQPRLPRMNMKTNPSREIAKTNLPNTRKDTKHHGTSLQLQRRPCRFAREVLEQARDELVNWQGCGMSVMEMSHRGKEYMGIQAQAEADLRELMGIPPITRCCFCKAAPPCSSRWCR